MLGPLLDSIHSPLYVVVVVVVIVFFVAGRCRGGAMCDALKSPHQAALRIKLPKRCGGADFPGPG